jgi:hypothetical protein
MSLRPVRNFVDNLVHPVKNTIKAAREIRMSDEEKEEAMKTT